MNISAFVGKLYPYKVRMACGHIEDRLMSPTTAGHGQPTGRLDYDERASWQVSSKMPCASCEKDRAKARQAQSPPREGELHVFHPEMHEERAADRLFFSRFVWGDAYSLTWPASRDAEARAILKANRVRPKKGAGKDPIELHEPGRNYHGKVPVYSCLITSAAHWKLRGYCTHEQLLD